MRLYARLTWQAKEPAALAGELSRRLGVPASPGGLATGAWLLDLGTAPLEVRPWVREGPTDEPRAPGRLMLEPVPDGEDPPGHPADARVVLLGLGWATVDLDRAEDELSMWLGPRPAVPTDPGATAAGPANGPAAAAADAAAAPAGDGVDQHLGARTRLRAGGGLPGAWTVLLEPSTEGRAAAALARDGEGPVAIYLAPAEGLEPWIRAARGRGVAVGDGRVGPFGRSVLLAGVPTGPHVLVCEGRTAGGDAPPGGATSTIAP